MILRVGASDSLRTTRTLQASPDRCGSETESADPRPERPIDRFESSALDSDLSPESLQIIDEILDSVP